MAKVDVVTSIEILKPLAKVAHFASEPDNAPRWYANIESVKWETPRPLVLGSRFSFVARFLGRTISYTYVVAELEPLERMVMQTHEGPFPMQTTYEWEALSRKVTRMTLRNKGAPTGFSRIAGPMMSRAVRKANEKDLLTLKSILDG